MKQHTVPQNIMSVEFKIFGDLSIRQFIYISVAGGLAFIFYLLYLPGIVKWPLIVLSVLIGILITFAKVNERPFDVWINNFITAVLYPTQRVWQKELELPSYLQMQDEGQQKKDTNHAVAKPAGYQNVISYINSRNLPTDEVYKPNTKLDIEEIKMLTTIDKAMKGVFMPQQTTSSVTVAAPVQKIESDAIQPSVQSNVPNSSVFPSTLQSQPVSTPRFDPQALQYTTNNDNNGQVVINPPDPALDNEDNNDIVNKANINTTIPIMDDQNITNATIDDTKPQDTANDIFTIEPNTIVRLDELKNLSEDSLAADAPSEESIKQEVIGKPTDVVEIPTVEPDIFIKQDTLPIEDSISTASSQDRSLLEEHTDVQVEPEAPAEKNPIDEILLPESIQQEPQIEVDTSPNTTQAADQEIPGGQIDQVQEQLQKLEEENRRLQEQLSQLQQKEQPVLSPTVEVTPEEGQNQVQQNPTETIEQTTEEKNKLFGHMPDFIRYPNIISGVVVDGNEKFVEDVVVIIKDKSKRIMRAMKTNILGQFYSRNPLVNGEYDVEANKEGYIFESINMQLRGEVVDPLLIHPKKFETKIESGVNFTLYDKN